MLLENCGPKVKKLWFSKNRLKGHIWSRRIGRYFWLRDLQNPRNVRNVRSSDSWWTFRNEVRPWPWSSQKRQNEWLEAFDHDQLSYKNLRCLLGEATDHHRYSLGMKKAELQIAVLIECQWFVASQSIRPVIFHEEQWPTNYPRSDTRRWSSPQLGVLSESLAKVWEGCRQCWERMWTWNPICTVLRSNSVTPVELYATKELVMLNICWRPKDPKMSVSSASAIVQDNVMSTNEENDLKAKPQRNWVFVEGSEHVSDIVPVVSSWTQTTISEEILASIESTIVTSSSVAATDQTEMYYGVVGK